MVNNSLEKDKEVQIMVVDWECYLKAVKTWYTKTLTLYLYDISFNTEPEFI